MRAATERDLVICTTDVAESVYRQINHREMKSQIIKIIEGVKERKHAKQAESTNPNAKSDKAKMRDRYTDETQASLGSQTDR